MIRILLADDEHLVRAGYRMILGPEPDLEVVGEAADGVDTIAAGRRLRPDVVLMDIRMPRLDGIAATHALQTLTPPPAVVVVTTFDLDEYVFEALRAGAVGFLLKDAPEQQLIAALRSAHEGVALFSPSVTRRLIETYVSRPADAVGSACLNLLTDREKEVLTQVALGASNAQISATLAIGEATVKTHVSRVLMKLGLSSRSQAVVLAYETGLVRPGQNRTMSTSLRPSTRRRDE